MLKCRQRPRMKGLRFRGPDPSALTGGRRRHELGMSHRRENYFNPAGCWHLDRIPGKLRGEFESVVASCLANGKPAESLTAALRASLA